MFPIKDKLNLISKNTSFVDCDAAAYRAMYGMCLICTGGQTQRKVLIMNFKTNTSNLF
jgi:hypothetical protein